MALEHRLPIISLLAVLSLGTGVCFSIFVVARLAAGGLTSIEYTLWGMAAATAVSYLVAGILFMLKRHLARVLFSINLLASCLMIAASIFLAWGPEQLPFRIALLAIQLLILFVAIIGVLVANHESVVKEFSAVKCAHSHNEQQDT